jgi:hypothetical protein
LYHERRERLHSLVATAAAELALLGSVVALPNGDEVLGILADAAGEPWSKRKRFPNPEQRVVEASGLLSNLLVVQALAEFDVFTGHLLADACEFGNTVRSRPALQHNHIDFHTPAPPMRAGCCTSLAGEFRRKNGLDPRVEQLAIALGLLLPPDFQLILPLFDFFRRARNRIVHNNALVGEDLENFAASPELGAAVTSWNAHFARRPEAKGYLTLSVDCSVPQFDEALWEG